MDIFRHGKNMFIHMFENIHIYIYVCDEGLKNVICIMVKGNAILCCI